MLGEVRLAQTGEMLGNVVADTNKTFLEISGLSPGLYLHQKHTNCSYMDNKISL